MQIRGVEHKIAVFLIFLTYVYRAIYGFFRFFVSIFYPLLLIAEYFILVKIIFQTIERIPNTNLMIEYKKKIFLSFFKTILFYYIFFLSLYYLTDGFLIAFDKTNFYLDLGFRSFEVILFWIFSYKIRSRQNSIFTHDLITYITGNRVVPRFLQASINKETPNTEIYCLTLIPDSHPSVMLATPI